MDKMKAERIAKMLSKEGVKADAVQTGGNVYNVVIRGKALEGADEGVYEISLSDFSFGFGNVEFGDPAVFDYCD
jgi:hypothetical protein